MWNQVELWWGAAHRRQDARIVSGDVAFFEHRTNFVRRTSRREVCSSLTTGSTPGCPFLSGTALLTCCSTRATLLDQHMQKKLRPHVVFDIVSDLPTASLDFSANLPQLQVLIVERRTTNIFCVISTINALLGLMWAII